MEHSAMKDTGNAGGAQRKRKFSSGDWTVLTEKVAEAEGPKLWNQSVQDSSHGSVICSLYGLGHISALLLCGPRSWHHLGACYTLWIAGSTQGP